MKGPIPLIMSNEEFPDKLVDLHDMSWPDEDFNPVCVASYLNPESTGQEWIKYLPHWAVRQISERCEWQFEGFPVPIGDKYTDFVFATTSEIVNTGDIDIVKEALWYADRSLESWHVMTPKMFQHPDAKLQKSGPLKVVLRVANGKGG